MKRNKYKIGLDEVGRGPIAGPITVGCVALPAKYTWGYFKSLEERCVVPPLRDSKKLTEKQREAWYLWITNQGDIYWSIASETAAKIDKVGIVKAGNTAADRAYQQTAASLDQLLSPGLRSSPLNTISLDRGLRLQDDVTQKSHTKGDERFVEIALASIIAKVTRDRYMVRLDMKYPMYSLASNKGYGSKAHYTALKSHGLSKMHRRTFVHCV